MELLTTGNGKYRIEFMSAATFSGAMQVSVGIPADDIIAALAYTVPLALQIIREYFCQEESVCVGSGINKNPVATEEMLEVCADAALDGVSLVAVAIDSGEVVAAVFNKIEELDPPENSFYKTFTERCTQPETQELVNFFGEMHSRINFFERYDIDCLFEIMILGTIPNHRYNGLGFLLCKESLKIATKLKNGLLKINELNLMTIKDLGPKYSFLPPRKPTTKIPKLVTSVFSAVGSQKIGKALNFYVDLRISFKTFKNGKAFEERIGAERFLEACSIKIN